jgi:hypothetical protein
LKAQDLDQPIKQDGSVMIPDGATDAAITQIGANVVEIRCRPSEAAGGVHRLHGVGEIGIGK